jgi:plastocyanin
MHYVLVPLTFRIIFLMIGFFLIAPSSSPRALSGVEVEVVIRNSTFEFHGGILKPNEPAVIHLQNTDDIRHGFMSSLFENVEVEVETAGGVVYGKNIRGVHVDPGEAIEIRFTPLMSGQYTFRCDLHPKMKGELLVLSIGTA